MDSQPRRHFSPEEKVAILRRHFLEKVSIAALCDEYGISPGNFYNWQKIAFENLASTFEQNGRRTRSAESGKDQKIAALEAKVQRKNEVLAELMEEHTALKKSWGTLNGAWTPHDTRDAVIDFVNRWTDKTELPTQRFVGWLGIGSSKFYHWKGRYGKVNEHNATVPRDHWLADWEKKAIVDFHAQFPLEGYRRLTFMMLDRDIVAVSPTSVYRVLKQAGLLQRFNGKPSRKGTGFVQPLKAHEHWHVDVSYLNIAGTFYFLCSLLDGFSRFIVHWEIRPTMKEAETEIIIQRGREKFPDAKPRIITDNGPQFLAREFKEFIRICGMTHVKTSPYYPQSNGKIERWHRTLKGDCIRQQTPLCLEDAQRVVSRYVDHYNVCRLHSAIGYVTPIDKLEGRASAIHDERDRKLEAARERRKALRQADHQRLPQKPAIDFPAVRAAISMAEVLELLAFSGRLTSGHQQRGPCPIHSSPSFRGRSFSANLADNTFHCFKCGKGGNHLDLWAAASKQTVYRAAIDLCNKLHRPIPHHGQPQSPGHREEEPVDIANAICTNSTRGV